MSALGHNRTYAVQQKGCYSITSSAGEHARRDGDAERLRGVQIDHELEFGRLHDRQVGGFGALENPAGVDADLTIGVGKAGSVAHQTAGCGKVAPFIDRRHRMACRQHDKLLAPVVEEWRCADQERSGPLSDEGRERGVEIAFRIGTHDNELHAQAGSRLLHVAQLVFGIRNSSG